MHKSTTSSAVEREAVIQLCGYTGEIFGAQPFRHSISTLTILQNRLRLYVCDRVGFHGLFGYDVGMKRRTGLRNLIEVTLALTAMSFASLGFDQDIFSNPACTEMWTPSMKLPDGIRGYVNIDRSLRSTRAPIHKAAPCLPRECMFLSDETERWLFAKA